MSLKTVSLQALAYSLVFLLSTASQCWLQFFKCESVDKVTFLEALVPVLAVFALVYAVGAFAAVSNALLVSRLSKGCFMSRLVLELGIGAFCGVLPRLLWEAMSGGWPGAFYPHLTWAPFVFGGIAIALLARTKPGVPNVA